MAARRLEVRGGSGAQGFIRNSRGLTRDGPTLRMLEVVLLAGMHEQGQLSSDGGYYPCSIASFSSRCQALNGHLRYHVLGKALGSTCKTQLCLFSPLVKVSAFACDFICIAEVRREDGFNLIIEELHKQLLESSSSSYVPVGASVV
jgi:hypothetical protein